MFARNSEKLLIECTERNESIWEYTLREEVERSDLTAEQIMKKMEKNLIVMREATEEGMNKEVMSVSGLIGGDAPKLKTYASLSGGICGEFMNKAMARALAASEVNASMGRIVASPTAGSCGILPGVILSVGEKLNLSDEEMVRGLLTASGVGILIAQNATLSGAEGGCQAEVGSAAAMGAAATVEMMGGTPEMALSAAATVLKNLLGLVCDPVAGLVEIPCAKRNVAGVVLALTMADMAMSGIISRIPFDDMVETMYRVGKSMPASLRETADGGIATCKTGCELRCKVYGE